MLSSALFFRKVLTEGVYAGLDYMIIHVPFKTFIHRALTSGQLPAWVPDLGFGMPFVANGDAAVFYPLSFIFFGMPPGRAIGFEIWLHASLSILSMYAFCRVALRASRGASFAAGILYALSGFFVSHAGFRGYVYAYPWVPLLLLSIDQSMKRRFTWVLLGAAALGMTFLGGNPQIMYFTSVWIPLFILTRAWSLAGWRSVRRGLAATIASLAGGIAFAAIQVLPQAELVALGSRGGGGLSFADATFGSLPPDLWSKIFLPDFTKSAYGENVAWVGVLAVALAVVGIVALLRKRGWTDVVLWPCMAVGSWLLALGSGLPGYRFLLSVPLMSRFRFPVRWLFPAVLAIAVMAAVGLDVLTNRQLPKKKRTRYVGWFLLAGSVVVAWSAYSRWETPWEQHRRLAYASALALLMGLAAVIANRLSLSTPAVARATIAVAILFELIAVSLFMEYNHPAKPDLYTKPGPLALYVNSHGGGRILSIAPEPFGGWVEAPRRIGGNTALMVPVESAAGFGGLWPPAATSPFHDLTARLGQASDPAEVERHLALLRTAGVKWIIADASQSALGKTAQLTQAAEDRDLRLFEVKGDALRARGYCGANPAGTPVDSERVVFGSSFDPQVLLVQGISKSEGRASPATCGRVSIVRSTPSQVEIHADLPGAGWVLLADTFYPGWYAEVDGQPNRIYRADHSFRAVRVGAGSHRIEMRYSPRSIWIGAAISGVSVVALLVVLILQTIGALRRRRGTGSPHFIEN